MAKWIPERLPLNTPHLNTALHLTVWVGGLALFTLVAVQSLDVELSIYRSVVNILLLAVLFYLNSICLVNRYLIKGRYFLFYLLAIGLLIGLSELRTWINYIFELSVYEGMFNHKANPRAPTYTSSAAVLIVSTLFQLLQLETKRQQQALILKNQYQEAQLQFLKAQINPHFLFNTLNNIYSLAILESKETPSMILKLSDMLRYAIYEGQKSSVLLSKEWRQIEQLVELFQMKSAAPMSIQLEVQGDWKSLQVEPMLLIPLVENCLKHTDFILNPAAYAQIQLLLKEQHFIFKTINSKATEPYNKDKIGGVGLANIRSRLELNYSGQYQLDIKKTDVTFELSLSMPYFKRGQNSNL